jgi:hypothetical protein
MRASEGDALNELIEAFALICCGLDQPPQLFALLFRKLSSRRTATITLSAFQFILLLFEEA